MIALPPEIAKMLLEAVRPESPTGPDEFAPDVRDILKPWQQAQRADIGVVGVPFDTAVVMRRGCRFGPSSVRRALKFMYTAEPGLDVDLSSGLDIADFGDVDVVHTDVLKTMEKTEKVLTAVHQLGITPLMLGGDHSLGYSAVKATASLGGKIGLVTIDAHLDLRASHHGEITEGTPWRRVLDDLGDQVPAENIVEIGINGWLANGYYMRYAKERGIRYITAREVHYRGIQEVIAEAIERASRGTDIIHFSVDIDALDIAWAPGTGCPSVGGLTCHQMLEAVYQIGRHPKVRAMDLVGVAEPLDTNNITSIVAAQVLMHMWAATKARLGRGPADPPWAQR